MLCMLCCIHILHTCFLIVVGKCRSTQFPQKQNNKSAKMALQLSHSTHEVAEFFRGCWSQVSDSGLKVSSLKHALKCICTPCPYVTFFPQAMMRDFSQC